MRRVTVVGGGSRTGAGVDRTGLLKDLKKQVAALEDDLRERSESVEEFRTRLEAEYARARDGKRTAATYGAWRDERVTQAAAAWVLACVFVRFCEDNQLIEWPFLAGPGERLRDAEERHEQFFREKPHLNNRDWLIEAFQHLADANETAAGLFDRRHNPLWELTPSYEAATELLAFWRRRGADGEILYDFTDEEWDTRFLGDLYQDLSEHARKTYALLQTPEFVEEFILDLTLEPAIEEFGLAPEGGLRTIDPACGSGHFLLGIFARLVEKWRTAEPGTDEWTVVRRALDSVHGCDKNPFAVSIARFRLLVAAMRAAGARRLVDAPSFPINVAVGDSLLHGRGAAGIQGELDLFAVEDGEGEAFQYATEDVGEFAKRVDLLGRGSYHVVVGNPPYIEVVDRQEKENYKAAYSACSGLWVLTVPFAQRLFQLAIRPTRVGGPAGFVGQITGNNFMKREFGRKLIEDYFSTVDVTHVIDTSGAILAGHSTPTVTLIGRNRTARQSGKVRVVRGIKQEVVIPAEGGYGPAWAAIVGQVNNPGSESDWVDVADVERSSLSRHPWSLQGGGASELLSRLEMASDRLEKYACRVGFFGDSHADEAFTLPSIGPLARKAELLLARESHRGDQVRDWSFTGSDLMVYPYGEGKQLLERSSLTQEFILHFWPWRNELWKRSTFGGGTYLSSGREWYEWHQLPKDQDAHHLAIAFAEVASHNHFTLVPAGRILNRTAPVVKLEKAATKDLHVSILAALNSSVACFWLKQVCHCKGNATASSGMADQPWSWNYQFNGTKVRQFPLPKELPLSLGRALALLVQCCAECGPSAVASRGPLTRASFDSARTKFDHLRRRMIALQEELDWQVYGHYGLLSEREAAMVISPSLPDMDVPEVNLGERAFEIVLARRAVSGEIDTAWFERHRVTPVTDIPNRWPRSYREIIQARINLIESRKDIALIERPEYKRRWAAEPWEKKEKAALRTWLLDRAEKPELWYGLRDGMKQPRPLTVSQLADALRDDEDFNSVAQLYATDHLDKPDLPLADVLAEIVADEHVPYLAAMRYKDSGLRNREQWEQVWDMQREEDRTGKRLDIPVPPKYKSADFQKASYWSNRGKLDVPKERFISYPEASPDADPTLLLGWAGWDHKDQAQALFNLIEDRTQQAGWGSDRIKPLLAGLLEVMPWVHQWHGEYDAEWEAVPADEFQAFFEELCAKHHVSEADLRAWRPEKKTRAKKKAAPKGKAADEQPALAEE
ncbi:BREX-2 system adenine-specific DNA-methyltransferase PglX [Streptomyces pactum]|uniref:BREX-2 system adenine-specific DNA-methyltransferase PglX n=1 Tax=Streptomyces pactum TaxID=68249 RepID=UPI0037002B3F